MTLYGWDLSNWDWSRHPVSLADAKAAGISLVTHKATEDTGYIDPYLSAYGRQLPGAAMPVAGTYHAMHPGSAQAQADFWFNAVNRYVPGWRGHPCWIWQIDAERWSGETRGPNLAEIHAAADRIVKLAGCAPTQVIAYAPRWLYGDQLRGLRYRLWQSDYAANPVAAYRSAYPGDHADRWAAYSGQTPLILQYGSQTRIGAQPTCDANAIRVSAAAQLQALFRPRPPVPSGPIVSTGRLDAGHQLAAGQTLRSPHGVYSLAMQTDGNLVLYRGTHAVWATYRFGAKRRLVMQPDGNLVVYGPDNRPVWATATNGKGGHRLAVQDDGNLVIYTASSRPVWASRTVGR